MAFATFEDVEARWRPLTADEQKRVDELLGDAATILARLVVVDDDDRNQAAALKLVSCNMVIRSMVAASSSAFGVDELRASMGPFDQTAHFANPNGDMYLTKLDKKLLGVGGGKGRILHHAYGVVTDD